MANYYYSTQPFLAWCLNHYFYQQTHWAFVASPFYPYKMPNPRSSNPFRAYEDLYEPVHDRDEFSGHVAQKRVNLRNGVNANASLLPRTLHRQLLKICMDIDIVFFYPIVYRVDMDIIDNSRLSISGSGLIGSNEHLIADLKDSEFDVLFADLQGDVDCSRLLSNGLNQNQVLRILQARC